MIRLLMFLLGKNYESCKSCETLKQQLAYANAQNKELTETLLNLVQPEPVHVQVNELKPVGPRAITFAKRRAELEKADREAARLKASSQFVAKSDSSVDIKATDNIAELEAELGVDSNAGTS